MISDIVMKQGCPANSPPPQGESFGSIMFCVGTRSPAKDTYGSFCFIHEAGAKAPKKIALVTTS
jgi:hypothetical protein